GREQLVRETLRRRKAARVGSVLDDDDPEIDWKILLQPRCDLFARRGAGALEIAAVDDVTFDVAAMNQRSRRRYIREARAHQRRRRPGATRTPTIVPTPARDRGKGGREGSAARDQVATSPRASASRRPIFRRALLARADEA